MRLSAAKAILLFSCGFLAAISPAHAGWLSSSPHSVNRPVMNVADKEQKQMNKFCPAGKIFVQDKGCVKKERGERLLKEQPKG